MRRQLIATATILCLAGFICTGVAMAQLPIPASTQFDINGFLQEATVTNPADAHSGGTLKVNGHVVIVPNETIVIFPANALTWQELFFQAPAPWGIPGNLGVTGMVNGVSAPTTGMAQNECALNLVAGLCPAPPLTTFEVHVVGNRVLGAPGTTGDVYIAGLIDIAQNGLNSGAGFINFIDYAAATLYVGGTTADGTTGARVKINDPNGRYSLATTSPDIRYTVDPDNPTIMAGSAYPMCLPRSAPAGGTTDILCPEENRPLLAPGVPAFSFYTANLTNTFGGTVVPPIAGTFPDSTKQAPFEVGDYVFFSGTMAKDLPLGSLTWAAGDGPTVGPLPALGTAATYISAHTINNNIAIYTFPGSNPAYIFTEVTLMGTGGLTVLGAGEAAIRTRFEGMTTDYSRPIHLYGIDVAPDGTTSDRDWGTIGVDPGPAGGLGAVQGRWRFRPPCLAFGTVPTKPQTQCVYGPDGVFLPPTREMRSVIEGLHGQVPGTLGAVTAANGIFYGQYHAPILEYIFPENVPGSPIVENNFNAFPFLAAGGYTSSAGTVALALNPWPSNIVPAGVCQAPTANAGGPYVAGSGLTVQVAGTATGTAGTFAWTASAGSFSNAAIANPVFTAPVVAALTTVNLTFTVTNACGTSAGTTTVTVNPPANPTISYTPPAPVISVPSGTPISLTATGVDVAGSTLNVTWTQTGGAPIVVVPNPKLCTGTTPVSCTLSFTVVLPVGAASTTILLAAEATNPATGLKSGPDSTTVTFIPAADAPLITSATYRTGKQRLDLTASTNAISPANNMFLNPYACENGASSLCPGGVYDPRTGVGNTFTNNGGGLYAITLVGPPPPACNLGGLYATPCTQFPLTVSTSFGGISPPKNLDKIRQ